MASNNDVGARTNISGLGITRRSLRPELSKDWRANMTQSTGPDDDGDADSEDGGVSIIPAGMRPGWVWGPRFKDSGTVANTEQDKKGNDEGTSLSGQEGPDELPRPFVPSNIVLGQPPVLTVDNARKAVIAGVMLNPNYRGALTEFHIENSSATAEENCSVRVHGIHPEASVKEIVNTVRTGKVYSINKCEPEVGFIETAAADIVFVTRSAAESYVAAVGHGVHIRSKPIKAGWNRNRVKEAKNLAPEESRVIRIRGPEDKLTIQILDDFFKKYFRFHLLTSKTWRSGPGYRTCELEFESVRPQADWARRVFKQHFDMKKFRLWFGPDPCDAGNQDRLTLPWRSRRRGNGGRFPPLQVGQAE